MIAVSLENEHESVYGWRVDFILVEQSTRYIVLIRETEERCILRMNINEKGQTELQDILSEEKFNDLIKKSLPLFY